MRLSITFRRLSLAIVASLIALLVCFPVSVVTIEAAVAQQSTSTNSEEEPEEHSTKEAAEVRQARVKRSVGHQPPIERLVAARPDVPRTLARATRPSHLSRYSVRRLL